jgi:hypothetical protein
MIRNPSGAAVIASFVTRKSPPSIRNVGPECELAQPAEQHGQLRGLGAGRNLP